MLGFTLLAYAEERNDFADMSPFWTHIAVMQADLSISSGRADMSGLIIGHPGTTHIIADAVLYRVDSNGALTPVFTQRNIRREGEVWRWNSFRIVPRGQNYRLTVYGTVFREGTSQTGTANSFVVHAH